MATRENEYYWRLYLFLNEGVSFLSRGIILRKLDVLGQDLSSLLRENEGQLRQNISLYSTDLDALFPADGMTNMDKWNANIYLCVIHTLFRALLSPKERTKLAVAQNVLKDLCDRQDGTKIDNLTYEEHVENIEEAFLVLTFNDDSKMKIDEIKKVYLDEPLDTNSLKTDIEKMKYHSCTKEKLVEFLETICVASENESGKAIDSDEKQKSIEENSEYKKSSEDAAGNNNTKDNDLETGSDEIGVCVTCGDLENSSDGLGTGDISADEEKEILDEIVNKATTPETDEERRNLAQQWEQSDLENSYRQKDFETCIRKKWEKWKQEPVNIAVIGRSGVGKSRLINAIRGCTSEDDPLYANVGTTETTSEVRSYNHPNNPLLKFWDLPGIGTKAFPRKHFIKDKSIDFYSYDLYLIVSADRFMEEEEYFAEEVEKSGKTFLFVRTKADVNEEEFKDFPLELQKMRNDCVEKLHLRKIKATDVYLISSKHVNHKQLDFDKLIIRLVCSLPELKREVILNSLKFSTKFLIRAKRAQLEKKAMTASLRSAAFAGGTPLPGLSFYVDCQIISNVLDEYRTTLCITETDLDDLAQQTGVSANKLKEKYRIRSISTFKNTNYFLPSITKIGFSDVVKSACQLSPIGPVCGAGMSFYTTYKFLTAFLEIMVKESEKRLDVLLETTGKKIL